jgi:hypothetical protein
LLALDVSHDRARRLRGETDGGADTGTHDGANRTTHRAADHRAANCAAGRGGLTERCRWRQCQCGYGRDHMNTHVLPPLL